MNFRRHAIGALLAAVFAVGLAGSVLAQDFPTKQITIVVPFPPGGLTDQVARVVAQKMQDSLGKPVIVDNKPGAGGQIAGTQVSRADADGHTLFIGDTGALAINQGLYKKFSYDPLKDFQPVANLVSSPLILVVPKDSPANNVADLIALAKKKNGLNYASQGVGTIGHLLGEMFSTKIGVKLNHIAYKGSASALNDVAGGQVDLLFDPVISASPLVAGGKIKALAIAASKPASALPQLRTMADAGTPGVEASVWFGMVVKTGTPAAVVKKLNDEVVKALKSPDVVKRFNDQGLDVIASTPGEFGGFMKSETERWAPIVKASGATVE